MKTLLLCTTLADLSLPLFLLAEVRALVMVEVAFYEDGVESLRARLAEKHYDAAYLRDPYTTATLGVDDATAIFDAVARSFSADTYSVDGMCSGADALFEDKWRQYGEYASFMPRTEIYDPSCAFEHDAIYKERVSSRARGIFFRPEDLSPPFDRYVIQERHEVKTEYRIYGLFGRVLPLASRKSAKTEDRKVKVLATAAPPSGVYEFASRIAASVPYDFYGLDIIETTDGRYFLLEVNRSPQFAAYHGFSGVNLARELVLGLSHKLS